MTRHSLKGRKVIRHLLEKSKASRSGQLTLHYEATLPGLENDFAGAFLIPKASGKAVLRNKIRRWLREDLRLFQKEKPRPGAFLVRFYGSAAKVTHRHLSNHFIKLYEATETHA